MPTEETWTVVYSGVAWPTSAKIMAQIWNGSTTQTVKVYRIWLLNNQVTAVTGVMMPYELRRLTAVSTGGSPTTVYPTPHDSNNTVLSSNIIFNHGNTTINGTEVYWRSRYSGDEPSPGVISFDELSTIYDFALIWDSGYNDDNVEPLWIPPNSGIAIYTAGATSAVGMVDITIEFTVV